MPSPPPKPLPSSPAAPEPSPPQSPPARSKPKPERNTPHPAHAVSSRRRAAHRQSSRASPHAPAPAPHKTPRRGVPPHPRTPAATEPARTHTSDRENTQSTQPTAHRRSDT